MAASCSLHFLFLFTVLLSTSFHHVSAQTRPFVLPIKKDPSTNLYYSSVGIGTPRHNMNLVIDLKNQMLWYDCDNNYNSSSYHPVSCEAEFCSGCSGCNGPFKPGCTNNTCGANIDNPFAGFIFSGDFGEDILYISHAQLPKFVSGCSNSDAFTGDTVLLKGLSNGIKGIIGLSRSQHALPTQLSSTNKLPNKFSLCLPSNNKGFGDVIIGGSHPRSASKSVQTTPLIVNPVGTGPVVVEGVPSVEYFINVKSIKIDGNIVEFKSSLLTIDSKGNGGTKISTMIPYTSLHNSIFKPFVRQFVKKASDRKINRVAAVGPFEACFDLRTIGKTRAGLAVPTIDIVLEGGVQWIIYGANSMVMVKENVVCLGFVDGGTRPNSAFVTTPIVIGGHQLEDNLLEFDLTSSKLRFSSSLLLESASCSRV